MGVQVCPYGWPSDSWKRVRLDLFFISFPFYLTTRCHGLVSTVRRGWQDWHPLSRRIRSNTLLRVLYNLDSRLRIYLRYQVWVEHLLKDKLRSCSVSILTSRTSTTWHGYGYFSLDYLTGFIQDTLQCWSGHLWWDQALDHGLLSLGERTHCRGRIWPVQSDNSGRLLWNTRKWRLSSSSHCTVGHGISEQEP